ncbi:hypothetical protein D7V78_00930 [Parabacteroides distasonis]|uniref:Uncharacterized protein n=1 Tax=Parabacteroides distasonis TaxID=823 RepID=A0A3L7ZYI8_PARDI|nr:hypothetical protein [Parabacteroides distasonis]RLT75120.1 hypothetical protein D7V78_00930 [Parabacteroides distasonis]
MIFFYTFYSCHIKTSHHKHINFDLSICKVRYVLVYPSFAVTERSFAVAEHIFAVTERSFAVAEHIFAVAE